MRAHLVVKAPAVRDGFPQLREVKSMSPCGTSRGWLLTGTALPGTLHAGVAAAVMACCLTEGPPPPRFWGQTTEGTCVGYLLAREGPPADFV
ncbi:hypothetical protein CXZ05_11030 [Arthrobacter sp. AFG20]|nr:hypothetical protein CXZ05_11030 [Arthrobacter sp. AFG20]